MWMSQTGSIRGLTADGKSHCQATQVELTLSLSRVVVVVVVGEGRQGTSRHKMIHTWETSVTLTLA